MDQTSPAPFVSADNNPRQRRWVWGLIVLAFVALWLGVSWRYGWFPFIEQKSELQLMIEAGMAKGPSILTPEEMSELMQAGTAKGPSTLSATETAQMMQAGTAITQ